MLRHNFKRTAQTREKASIRRWPAEFDNDATVLDLAKFHGLNTAPGPRGYFFPDKLPFPVMHGGLPLEIQEIFLQSDQVDKAWT